MTEEEIRNLFIVNPLSAVRALQEENAALRAERDALRGAFRKLEWAASDVEHMPCCIVCGFHQPGHDDDCWLAALLNERKVTE